MPAALPPSRSGPADLKTDSSIISDLGLATPVGDIGTRFGIANCDNEIGKQNYLPEIQ